MAVRIIPQCKKPGCPRQAHTRLLCRTHLRELEEHMEVLEDLMAATGELLWEWDTRHRRGMRAPSVDSDFVKNVRMAHRRAQDILVPGRPLKDLD